MPNFPSNMKVTKEEVSQTFDIETEFGVDLSDEPRLRDEIGQAIIDRIRERCVDDNEDYLNRPLKKYDEDYDESDAFDDFNKSEADVNMTLTGKMLESIDFEDNQSVIKIEVAKKETPKAYNHQIGDTVERRSWFGMSKKEIGDIKKSFSNELKAAKAKQEPKRQSVLDLLATEQLETQTTEEAFGDLFSVSFPDIKLGDF